MKNIKRFLLNPYWSSLYKNSTRNVKKYYKLLWTYNDAPEYEKRFKLLDIINKFTYKDWEYVMSKSTGREKLKHTKLFLDKYKNIFKVLNHYSAKIHF